MPNRSDIKRYRENLQEEIDSAAQYRAMQEVERDPKLSAIYGKLADMEERHAGFWRSQLEKAGGLRGSGPTRPSLRSRVLVALARRFGPRAILGTVAAAEHADRNHYVGQPEARSTQMTAQENAHARILRAIELSQPHGGGVQGGVLARLEGRHRAIGGNALRAAVLGANDGLCSNLSLVMGMAGAAAGGRTLLVTGLAGLLAGACSMALGEWISVTSSRELASRELRIERAELEEDPAGEAEELELMYEAKGLSEAEAKDVSRQMMADPKAALDTMSREELGIDPENLGGSAAEAAFTSFVLFAVGAAIPVIPLLFVSGATAIEASILASALALFGIGAGIALFTGHSLVRTGLRQLALGLLAAAVTFGIGKLLGAAVAG